MSRDREATSEQSLLVCEGVGYDEVFLSSHGPKEGLSWSSEREPSTHSLVDEEEDYDGEEVEEREKEMRMSTTRVKERIRGSSREKMTKMRRGASIGGSSRNLGDGHTRPFILHTIWTVNDFKSMMTTKIFNNLRDCYQIPDNIPIHLPGKYEKC